MRSHNIPYIPAVDQLRAMAALMVFFYHGLHLYSYELRFHHPFDYNHWLRTDNPIYNFLIESHISVSLFMVLSGFILTSGAMSTGVRWLPFLRNRFLRIYPMLLLVVFVGISAHISEFSLSGLIQTLVGLGNLPGAINGPPFTATLWSVAVEWQYYLLFPALIAFVVRSEHHTLAGMIITIIVFRGLVALYSQSQAGQHFMIHGRLDQIMIGMLLAIALRDRDISKPQGWLILGGSAITIVAVSHFLNIMGGWPSEHWWRFLWPTLEALLWASFIAGYLVVAKSARNPLTTTLIFIGERSYSLYLLHITVMYALIQHQWIARFSEHILRDAVLNTLLIALPLAMTLSCLTYQFVEKPFLTLRTPYRKPAQEPAPHE